MIHLHNLYNKKQTLFIERSLTKYLFLRACAQSVRDTINTRHTKKKSKLLKQQLNEQLFSNHLQYDTRHRQVSLS